MLEIAANRASLFVVVDVESGNGVAILLTVAQYGVPDEAGAAVDLAICPPEDAKVIRPNFTFGVLATRFRRTSTATALFGASAVPLRKFR